MHRRNDAVKNVIKAAVVVDTFHRGDIARIFDNADTCPVSRGGTADVTGVVFSQVAADGTETNGAAGVANRIGERERVLFLIVENVESEALCRFLSDPRKFRERVNQLRDGR